jgi:hypothetical protein
MIGNMNIKSFREYLTETETAQDYPVAGDVFELEIAREEIVIETTVVDVLDDGIVIEADDAMMRILMHVGYLTEDSNMPTARDSISPIHDGINHEVSANDLAEQQGMSQDAFNDLDATISGKSNDFEQDADASIKAMRDKTAARRAAETPAQTAARRAATAARMATPAPDGSKRVSPDDQMDRDIKAHTARVNEAKYQGREVPLGKKMAGDVKKSKVYVRGPKGNVVKVNFGDPNMTIKKSNPARRKSFRARHNCANPGPRWKARYWSCRSW